MTDIRITLETMTKEIEQVLEVVGKKYGYTLKIGNTSYDTEGNFSTKLKGINQKEGAKSPEAIRYEALVEYKKMINEPMLPLGSQFVYGVDEYTIVGVNTTGTKILSKSTKNGKIYLFPVNLIEIFAKAQK